jgi:polar amino acid transport system substrate-binding protein
MSRGRDNTMPTRRVFGAVLAGAFGAATVFAAGAGAAFAQEAGGAGGRGSTAVPSEVLKELAPTGKLRAALNFFNGMLVQGPASDPRGVMVDLSRELARRTGLPLEFVAFDSAGKVFEGLKTARWDVAFFAIEPARAAEVDFTAPYVLMEGTYMVLKGSPLKVVADVDRPGARIAVIAGAAYDLYLTRTLKHAELVRAETGGGHGMIDRFLAEKLEAAAGVRQQLTDYARTDPNVRVMDGRFQAIEQAMGTPKGRPNAARYLRSFVEEMKASGFVADALRRSNQPDAAVAPPSPL